MAGASVDDRPLTTDGLAQHLADGCKPNGPFLIGAEHEKFVFRTATHAPVPYEPNGVLALLEGLKRFGWEGVYEGETLIALQRGKASVSLEPAGQFELSGAALESIHEICAETRRHLEEIKAVADPLGIGFLGLGFTPTWRREDCPIMPKQRYGIMRAYMPTVGGKGLDMMLRTCTVQANLDFASEADMIRKFRVSLALQPIATALFANSPFVEGKPSGLLSSRANVWTDTDPDRTGMLDFVFQEGFGFETYARYALDVPMYFVKRGGRYINTAGRSFRAFMQGELPELPGERATLGDWSDHLTTLFPEVRLKQYLEMRGADSGPATRICALPALWAGILYDSVALDAAWNLCKDWTSEQRAQLRLDAARTGLKGDIGLRTVQGVARDMVAIAKSGLRRRAKLNANAVDETGFLTEIEEIADSGVTPAERLLALYHGPWQGDAGRAFDDLAY
ncbi:MAG TPA: glutamate--cysteine ligase [Caulobacteraceae bacterium]|nr:glutamate--cysteine ligase [Caulobacteraceae bacterium]